MPLSGTRGPRIDGKASSRPRVYGCCGAEQIARVAPSSSTCPAYITISRSEKWLIRDMSWVTKMTAKPSACCRSLICTISERGGGLIHDDQLRGEQHGHRDHGALPHAAGELVGVAAQVQRVDADHLEHLGGPGARSAERRV